MVLRQLRWGSFWENVLKTSQQESQISKLWLNYMKYICIYRSFIQAKGTYDLSSHISALSKCCTKESLEGMYALYSELLQDASRCFQSFMKGNRTAGHSEKTWSGIGIDA